MLADSVSKQGTNFYDCKDSPTGLVRRKPGRPPKQHAPGTINGLVAECAVCHDKATGLHYAVMTCEGCKGFFKRSIQAEKVYKCKSKGECLINKESRNTCQACRMKRCFVTGMQERLVRDDRTPGNRKKNRREHNFMSPILSSENSDNAVDFGNHQPCGVVKEEIKCTTFDGDLSAQGYPVSRKRIYDNFNTDYCQNSYGINFGGLSFMENSLNQEMLCGNVSPIRDFEEWEMSQLASEATADVNTTDLIQHISSVSDHAHDNNENSAQLSINCSGDQEQPSKKCRQRPKCLMHLLTRLMKAKPIEPAFCKYSERYPTSEQFLDCLADEIHLIIKFAKKTPGFCELSMNRKLGVVQKNALSILFIRIIYRSLTCPDNHVLFGTNLCLDFSEMEKIDILSSRFSHAVIQLISTFKTLDLDIYEVCLIEYAIIEEEDWGPETRYHPLFEGFEKPTRNLSQMYLKLYTAKKYPEQPHRWIFIMFSLTQIQEMVKLFIEGCLAMVTAQRMVISNDILKEILSL